MSDRARERAGTAGERPGRERRLWAARVPGRGGASRWPCRSRRRGLGVAAGRSVLCGRGGWVTPGSRYRPHAFPVPCPASGGFALAAAAVGALGRALPHAPWGAFVPPRPAGCPGRDPRGLGLAASPARLRSPGRRGSLRACVTLGSTPCIGERIDGSVLLLLSWRLADGRLCLGVGQDLKPQAGFV